MGKARQLWDRAQKQREGADDLERRAIVLAFKEAGGVGKAAAEILGIERSHLYKIIRRKHPGLLDEIRG